MTAQRGYSTGKAYQPADAYPQPLINHPKNAVKTQKSGFPEVSTFMRYPKIWTTLQAYSLQQFGADLLAGITVAMVAMPLRAFSFHSGS